MSASSVSARLRRLGFSPLGSGTPRSREGIRVSGTITGRVVVAVDLDNDRQARELAASIEEALLEDGQRVERGIDGPILYVLELES